MAKELIGETITAFTQAIPTGSVAGISGVPGQIAVVIRYLSGGSLEIGGASLSAGTGMIIGNNAAVPPLVLQCSGNIYAIATSATAIITGFKVVSTGNPGSVG
jgi:hypothetical protein